MTVSIDHDPFRLYPANTVFPISGLDLKVSPGDHPWYLAERERAAENWRKEVAANPALFDGKMVFQHRLALQDGIIRGEAYMVPFSTFLWWRRQERPSGGLHLFCYPVPVSSDGAIIAVRMGERTANPGQVYCPAGSLDASDVVDGVCEVLGNMMREVREETGLDLRQADDDGRYFACHQERRMMVCRVFRFRQSADELLAAIERHMAEDEEQEIAGAIAIRSSDPDAHPYNPTMPPLLSWFFGGGT
ncbi:NUDIX hydrolase [Ciceribacter sp. L1K23]|uniref:NUDIX hydrolase n=1 Tax=Ciceribacter sp. L1K23 TaxID=2820276 RepID=UPI001B812809|nr:NUDIX hydrolase [Ciceribacter sp. L1K23]MBR0555204.1 NUDIX hydrolase [Ciceribacter sp. L1K23]